MRIASALTLVAALGIAAPARASVALALSVEQMTDRADLVVRGHVTSQDTAWTRAGRIVTTVHLTVDATLKGGATTSVDVEHLGGHMGRIAQQVEGEVSFTDGEEVLLFLRARAGTTSRFAVLGLSQGKFHIERSATTVMARQKLDGLGLVQKPGAPIEDKQGEAVPLSELESRVAAQLKRSKATP